VIAFTPDQEQFRKSVARFVDTEVAPAAQALDERGEFPAALFRRIGQLGYLGLRYPDKYGGADADMTTYCLFAEELARGSLSVAAAAAMQGLMGTHFIHKYGSETLRERYLVPALRGEIVATFAMTEPNAGSDVASLATRAERRGDRWVLRGVKTWVTSAPVADVLTVAAKTSDDRGMKNIALFLLDRASMRGITLGKAIDKMSVRASATGEILLEDVEVPPDHVLGGESGGVEKIGGILAEIRIMTAALSVGVARAAYEAALGYSRERAAFGKPIGEHQAIQLKLADMATRLEAARLLTRNAAERKAAGLRCDVEAGMAKLFASETALELATEAMRIHGGVGYTTELPVERYYRDAPLMVIGEGTNEIQRLVIARGLLARARAAREGR
jgi:alkylation response protein AidB-like acyl-CoA dehydrogenase